MDKDPVEYFQNHPVQFVGMILGIVAVATLIGHGTEIYIFPMLERWGW
jgi:hypothetical protein